jgi:F0F1-type ATP synthase assembly protein I
MEKKIVGILIGAVVGWVVDQIATDVFEQMGVPPKTATTLGTIAGALLG